MRIQWFTMPPHSTPFICVTADTRALCVKLAYEVSGALSVDRGTVSPRRDHKTENWTQSFNVKAIDCETVAKAFHAAIALGCSVSKGMQLTPPMGTRLDLLEETKW